MRRILITGSGGLLGPTLIDKARNYGDVVTVSRSAADIIIDLSDRLSTERVISRLRPDWVLHAAGMTNVDRCESSPKEAYKNNTTTVKNIVGSLPGTSRFLFISTDQVYPNILGPHKEADVGPINIYGRSKLLGEEATLIHPNAVVARVNFFGRSSTTDRHSLDDFIIESLTNKKNIVLFSDVYFSPLHMSTLASILFRLLEIEVTGAFNIGSRSGMSKSEFGFAVAAIMNLPTASASIGASASLLDRAPRSVYLRMDVTKVENVLGEKMPTLVTEIEKLK